MTILHSSKRRPEPLKPADYDHEIDLVDDTKHNHSRSQSAELHRPSTSSALSDSSSRRHSDAPLRNSRNLRKEITRRKYAKYQDKHLNDPGYQNDTDGTDGELAEESTDEVEAEGHSGPEDSRGRVGPEPVTSIDVLYENERGLFLCGIPFFSSKALGNLDPAQWTTIYQKRSLTDPTNHQVPDPSWEWLWKEWKINIENDVDEEGWEYSFMFSKKFNWHGPKWWNSYVRRRAWIRKRVKRGRGYNVQDSHMLNEDYFTIHPAQMRSHSRHSGVSNGRDEGSVARPSTEHKDLDEDLDISDIRDIGALLKVLRFLRIDREKMEAVQCFIRNGGDELFYLKDRMHDIMRQFIFQASRRLLLAHLIKELDQVTSQESAELETVSEEEKSSKERRLKNLQDAVKAADNEVKKLEFWSDVKDMAEKGETQGAVDVEQGWGESWTGLDISGPKDVISNRKMPGTADCDGFHVENGGTPLPASKKDIKGKGKEKEKE